MRTRHYVLIPSLSAIVIAASVITTVVLRPRPSGPEEMMDPNYQRFTQLVAEDRETEVMGLGNSLFQALLRKKLDDSGLALLAKKLEAAWKIEDLLADRIRPNQAAILDGIAAMNDLGLPAPTSGNAGGEEVLLPSARELYWTHLGPFRDEPVFERLTKQEAAFCRQYYELRMQDAIVGIGHQVIIANPESSELACHAMVLPLLYLHGRDDAWDQVESLLALLRPEVLDSLAKFILLQVERAEASMAVSRYRAMALGEEFSPVSWACDAADACVTNHRPDLADKLLRDVAAEMKDRDETTRLHLRIAEGYAQCGDYAVASQVCEETLADLPNASLYGRTVAIHLGYLAKDGDAEQVVARTASTLEDPRCKPHLAQILYLRWWALCKTNRSQEAVQIAQRLLEQYPRNPCVAPVLLERATDALAHQEYHQCRELLTRLTNDFANTESARRARDILARLKTSVGGE
jgi:tetratricopeptide (TPR) repeat protein